MHLLQKGEQLRPKEGEGGQAQVARVGLVVALPQGEEEEEVLPLEAGVEALVPADARDVGQLRYWHHVPMNS